jgi:Protein of unknown function (DUF2800)
VTLDELLRLSGEVEEDDPDYRRDGTQAHDLGAKCLSGEMDAWEGADPAEFPEITEEMMDAVQVYLDFCRTLPGRITLVEHKMHRPEFHRLAFGTGDFISVHILDAVVDFVDYKHGVGVVVEVEDNPQLMYYVYLFIGEDRDEYPDELSVRMHIVQPRADHPAGLIRTWEVRAGTIRAWAKDTLRPAMERTAKDRYLSMGEWCRFCPAKTICPAMACLGDEMVHKIAKHDPAERVKLLDDAGLGDWYAKAQLLKMYIKAIEDETERRVLNGVAVPGTKAVNKKSWMVWKDAAPIRQTFGDAGFDPKSPAQLRTLDGGKEFAAEWSYNVNNGKYALAPETDKRAAVQIANGAQTFGAAVQQLEAAE